ncbi:CDP-glycerol glycerophosphotransferase [Rhizobium sp. ACO-34A]|nr:CDP-glycerol glycerophosphotransferase [Rhizobium sp. ACO-34A]
MTKHYLLYGSERYALAILRPIQAAIRARGDKVAWFFDGPGAEELTADETLLTVAQVRAWKPYAVITSSNAVPHFFPGVKVETFHGFDAGKPRHIYVRGFFDLYCTTGPRDTTAFSELSRQLGHFKVVETGFPKIDPFMTQLGNASEPVRKPPLILYHSTFSPSWSAAPVLYDEIQRLSQSGEFRWVVSFHPKMDPVIVARYKTLQNEYLSFAENDNILELFSQVDLMCSDTSSALNEFLLTYKPVVTFRNRRPGPHLIDIDDPAQFEPAIRRALSRPPELMSAVREFADQLHPYRDGCSSERVLEAIDAYVAAGARTPRPKPANLWRKFKIRKRIGYWGPAGI